MLAQWRDGILVTQDRELKIVGWGGTITGYERIIVLVPVFVVLV
jgi:hypothetical protein